MSSPRAGLRVGAIIFGLVCLGHLWRLLRHVDVRIGTHDIPMWISVVGIIIAGGLSLWMWKLSARD
jgi:hypothetical protein